MRNENLELIERNLFVPEDDLKVTESQKLLLKEVADCYNLQLQKPMYSRTMLRNYLIKKYKCSKVQAYKIIQYAAVVLGNVQPSHKNWVRQRIEFLGEQAYAAAEAKDYKRVDALTKIAATLAKAFATNIDEGELINAQEYLQIPEVVITVNPADINVKIKEPEQKEIDRMLRKYEIEDVDAEEVKEEPADNEII